MRGGSLLARFWPSALLLLCAGCVAPALEIAPPRLSFQELKEKTSRIAGLPLRGDITLETRPAPIIEATAEESFWAENGKEELRQRGRVYARLGLVPEGTDLAKGLLQLRLSRQAVYDRRAGLILLPSGPLKPDPTFLASPSMSGEAARQLLLISELCFILQEQHFHLERRIRNIGTEDSRLALRALKKGDAALVGLAYLMGGPKEERGKVIDGVRGLDRTLIDRDLSQIPELLRREASFQYLEGSAFVSWAYSLRGWEGVHALFQSPPLSTHQLLHPEKYYAQREDPLRIVPWGLLRELPGKKIMDDTLGEFLIRLLLSRTLSESESRQAAAGWAGDSLLAFQQGETLVLGWVTAWDRPDDAGLFLTSFRSALERLHGISFQPSPAPPDTLVAPAGSSRPLLLQRKDRFVLYLDGVPSSRSLEIAASVWSDLETGNEPEPLELSRATLTPAGSMNSALPSW